MSLYITADKRALRKIVNIPAAANAFTICGFYKILSVPSGHQGYPVYAQTDASAATLEFNGGPPSLDLQAGDNYSATTSSTIATLTTGGSTGTNWSFIGLRGTASGAGGLKGSHKPVGSGSMSHQTVNNTLGSAAITAIQLGDLPFGTTYWLEALFAHWMIYDRALSDGEMDTQAGQGTPASATNLISYHSFADSDPTAILAPQQGTGSFYWFTTEGSTSTDMPVFSGDPVFSGSVLLPSAIFASPSSGAPYPLLRSIRS